MQADMVGDFLLRVSVLSLSNAKIKDLTLLFCSAMEIEHRENRGRIFFDKPAAMPPLTAHT